jgi:radical SAM superfamily enzyme YgiQ (UPF0313 family)
MGKKLRYRSPKLVLDEIEYLHKVLGQNYFEFLDDNINVNKKHALSIFKGIVERKFDIQFSLNSGIHIASVDNELIDVMAEAGLVMIKLPIEHGNDFIRNIIIGKHLEREKIVSVASHIKKYDIFIFSLFIMGLPEDTPETLDDTIQLIEEISPDINIVAPLIPFPGTKIYNQCVNENLFFDTIKNTNIYCGDLTLDPVSRFFYIKPHKMTLEQLQEYRVKFDAMYLYSDRAKRLNGLLE